MHVADPENSCRGIIKLPVSLVEGNVLAILCDSNLTINLLAAQRMGSTDSILVTFEGSKIPFYIDYLRTDLHCRSYRQKVKACTKCRQLGHRQDVCPNVAICLCPKCGTPDTPEGHSCTPTCIICNGAHETSFPETREAAEQLWPKELCNSGPAPIIEASLASADSIQRGETTHQPYEDRPTEQMDIVAPTQTRPPTEQTDTVVPTTTTEAAAPRPPSPHMQPPPANRKNAEITDTDNTVENSIFVLSDHMTTLENKLVALQIGYKASLMPSF
ncbi:hypothetical protein HPB49_023864 [Dermacentor silvarum]|uniref:Uncharacterized protein n=1 Tax=Dermacentor silvarum TaxID=543639 RepID=A0ACB8CC74_DERSI|nr:hypothetical protein HPB49_023864 [Dermacentor silvarum]